MVYIDCGAATFFLKSVELHTRATGNSRNHYYCASNREDDISIWYETIYLATLTLHLRFPFIPAL